MGYFNEGNDCDMCKHQFLTGRDGDALDCRRRELELPCQFEERDIRTCPVCNNEVDREDMDFGYYNMDCVEGMKQFPDKYFDLAIVDPPYGIKVKNNMGRRHGTKKSNYPKAYWDKVAPPPEYFTELFRVAKHSIIWGGNYFDLPPTKCFVIWDKPDKSENVTFAMCEYAWTDFDMTAKIFRKYAKDDCRIHATQKPVDLYMWLLRVFAKEGDKILDTHVGSASSLIACHKMGFQYVGFELDKYYYDLSNKRLEQEKAQMSLFDFMGG